MTLTPEFLQKALDNLKREIFETLHVSMPGIIRSYNEPDGTADIQPALRRELQTGTVLTMPLLKNVPVISHSSSEILPDTPCLLIFTDFCLDGFLQTNQPVIPPSHRTHDLSDAIAIVGFRKGEPS